MKNKILILFSLLALVYSCSNEVNYSGTWNGVLSRLEFMNGGVLVINYYDNNATEYKYIKDNTYYSSETQDTVIVNQVSNDTIRIFNLSSPDYVFTHYRNMPNDNSISTQVLLKFLKSDTLQITFESSYQDGLISFNDRSFIWLENGQQYNWCLNKFNNSLYLEMENDIETVICKVISFDSNELVLWSYSSDNKKEIISRIKTEHNPGDQS